MAFGKTIHTAFSRHSGLVLNFAECTNYKPILRRSLIYAVDDFVYGAIQVFIITFIDTLIVLITNAGGKVRKFGGTYTRAIIINYLETIT